MGVAIYNLSWDIFRLPNNNFSRFCTISLSRGITRFERQT